MTVARGRRLCQAHLLVLVLTLLVLGPGSVVRARAASSPFEDPQAKGYIGFCDQAGNPVTSGSIKSKPFVWLAVSSSSTPAGYTGHGQSATLMAYQPQEGVLAANWTGDQMTAASYYTNMDHPMVEAAGDNSSLADYLQDLPLKWEGLIEVRMYFGLPAVGVYTNTYPATFIQVSGDTWNVVHGGNVTCTDGYALSGEGNAVPPVAGATTSPAPSSAATAAPAATNGPKAAGGEQVAGTSLPRGQASGSSDDSPLQPTADPPSLGPINRAVGSGASTSSGASVAAVVAGIVIVLLVAGGLLLRRSRRHKAPPGAGYG